MIIINCYQHSQQTMWKSLVSVWKHLDIHCSEGFGNNSFIIVQSSVDPAIPRPGLGDTVRVSEPGHQLNVHGREVLVDGIVSPLQFLSLEDYAVPDLTVSQFEQHHRDWRHFSSIFKFRRRKWVSSHDVGRRHTIHIQLIIQERQHCV